MATLRSVKVKLSSSDSEVLVGVGLMLVWVILS